MKSKLMTTMVLGQDQLRIQDLVQNPALNHIQDPAQDHVRDQDLGLGHGIQEIDQGQEVEAVHAVDAAPDLVAGQGHILTPRKGEGPDLALAVHITTGTEGICFIVCSVEQCNLRAYIILLESVPCVCENCCSTLYFLDNDLLSREIALVLLYMLCDWSRKLVPPIQPIRCKTI